MVVTSYPLSKAVAICCLASSCPDMDVVLWRLSGLGSILPALFLTTISVAAATIVLLCLRFNCIVFIPVLHHGTASLGIRILFLCHLHLYKLDLCLSVYHIMRSRFGSIKNSFLYLGRIYGRIGQDSITLHFVRRRSLPFL